MIDYNIISKNMDFFTEKGFQRVETPWTVTKKIIDITLPKGCKPFELKHTDEKCLVGSAEQGFLYQYSKGFLPKGKFQSVSPCFRLDSFDETHTKYFIKNELIDTTLSISPFQLAELGLEFFSHYPIKKYLSIETTEQGYDLMLKCDETKIELGSYGFRSCHFIDWVYGTGVAEPRFSTALNRMNNL